MALLFRPPFPSRPASRPSPDGAIRSTRRPSIQGHATFEGPSPEPGGRGGPVDPGGPGVPAGHAPRPGPRLTSPGIPPADTSARKTWVDPVEFPDHILRDRRIFTKP